MESELKIPDSLPENEPLTPNGGLSAAEAAARMDAGQGNAAQEDPGRSVWEIVASNLFTPFNLLNTALAACLLAVGAFRNMLFMGVVISNTLIGTVQELRARKTIRRLKLLNIPSVRVMRGGQEQRVQADQLVRGDLVILEAGCQVPADAIVRSGEGAANESLLTGESDAVQKGPGAWVMSGSYLTEGRLEAQLVYVGEASYINRLTRSARQIRQPKSALMNDLNRLVRLVSMILTPLGILLFCKQYFLGGEPLHSAIPTAVAAMIGMIPEGLLLLTSVALTVGVITLGRRQTLVQELYGIETLARADVLCLDKTGTITTGEMLLKKTIPCCVTDEELRAKAARFLGAFDAGGGTLGALRGAIAPGTEAPTAVLPFSSARKKSAASFMDGETLVLGAPSFVMPDGLPDELAQAAAQEAAQGRRVLLMARCGAIVDSDTTGTPEPLGLFVIEDVIRDSAAKTMSYFREEGVDIRIISGDDPRTVAAIARRIGLEGADRYVDASTLRTEEAIHEACEKYVVFGRVTPEQKRQLVEGLKAAGHSVAMTGDGVNDIPALKAADCSIAMAGGSDAARHTAQLTLLDSDFASLPAVVAEGRRVVNNITRASSLFLIKTLYSFALSVLLLVLPAAYPFQPIQLTLVSTMTIGLPSFFLALEPNHERLRGDFLRTVLTRAVPGAAAVAVCAALSMLLARLGWQQEVCSTIATLTAGILGLVSLARVCVPFTRLRAAVLAGMTAGFAAIAMLLGWIFFLTPLTASQALVLAGLSILGTAVMAGVSFVMTRRGRNSSMSA